MAQRLKRGEKDKNHFFTSQCVCVCVIVNCTCYELVY